MARIVAIGSAFQDIYLIDHDDLASVDIAGQSIFGQLKVGSKVNIDKIQYDVGGGGTNAAVCFARHGHETIYMGSIGRDVAGEAILACLDAEGIDNSYVETVRGETGCSVILLDAKSGERTILTHRGTAQNFSKLKAADLARIQPDWIYVTSLHDGNMEKLLELFEAAHEVGAKVMYNPGTLELKKTAKLIGLLEEVDVLILNKAEAAQIVPGVLLTELLDKLRHYCPIIIITDGMMGAIATNGQETYRLGVYEQVKVRDCTGAGDAFGAGFLAKWADGANFRSALEFASANASSVVSRYGAKAGLLYGHEELHPMPIQRIEDSKTSQERELC